MRFRLTPQVGGTYKVKNPFKVGYIDVQVLLRRPHDDFTEQSFYCKDLNTKSKIFNKMDCRISDFVGFEYLRRVNLREEIFEDDTEDDNYDEEDNGEL